MTEREIILTGAAVDLKQQAENLYLAINDHSDKDIEKAIANVRQLSLTLQLANSNLPTPDIKAKYLNQK